MSRCSQALEAALREVTQAVSSLTGLRLVAPLEPLQAKDGVYVFRARVPGSSLVAKYLAHEPDRREISNYRMLQELGVPTLAVLGSTESCLLLEDLDASACWRVGTPQDLGDARVAVNLSAWYRTLHVLGAGVESLNGLYAETALIDVAAIQALADRFPEAQETWKALLSRLGELHELVATLDATLTYNDFFWSNLAVARDGSCALMFDYNLLGRGYRYADVRNVCSALAPQAARAFQVAYGPLDPREAAVDACLSPLVTLIEGARRSTLPSWAQESLEAARDGSLLAGLTALHKA